MIRLLAVLVVAISGVNLRPSTAQEWPSRPVTMVIPFAAGGNADVLGRIMAQRMSEILGQQIIVENVGGAGGMTGSNRVAHAASDGYTSILGTTGTHAQLQSLYLKPQYDAATDFTPVALISEVPIVLIARKDFPAGNFSEFAAYAKNNQATMQYGSAGAGSASHLGCVVLDAVMGTRVTHVPYRGTGPAMQDLQGGRIDYLCEFVSVAKPQIIAGNVKPLVVMNTTRSPVLPEVPSAADALVPQLKAYTWNAVFLPKNAPPDIVKKLNDAVVRALNTPAIREKLEASGLTLVPTEQRTPQFLGQFVRSEIDKWAAVIRASGATMQ